MLSATPSSTSVPQGCSQDEAALQVVSKPHHTLVTLLLCNAVALEVHCQTVCAVNPQRPCFTESGVLMQALPIFLDRLVDPVTAVVLSVTVVLFFGECPALHGFLHVGKE